MFRSRSALLITLLQMSVPATVFSQTIGTDRPDFVESSATVGKGSLQVEGSFAFDEKEIQGVDVSNWTTPFLFRVGVADAWEVRLESDWLTRSTLGEGQESPDLVSNGVADFAVGVKWAFLAPESGSTPAMAALVHADLPTGSDDFRTNGTRPSLRLAAEWGLEGAWGIGAMPGLIYDRDEGRRFVSGIFGVVVGKGLSDSLRAFVEIFFEQITEDQYGGNVGFLDFGGTFLLNPRWQLDAAAAVGVTDQAADFAFTVGLSGLFPR